MDSSLDFAAMVAPSDFDPHRARPVRTLPDPPFGPETFGPVIGPGERATARRYPIDLLALALGAASQRRDGGGDGGGDGSKDGGAGGEATPGAAMDETRPDEAARIRAIGELAQDLKAKGDEARRLGETLRRLEDEQRALKARLEALLGMTRAHGGARRRKESRGEDDLPRTPSGFAAAARGLAMTRAMESEWGDRSGAIGVGGW